MNPKRRSFLKGALASGAGGLILSHSGLTQAAMGITTGNSPATLVLAGNAAIESSFAAGIQAALPGEAVTLLRTDHSNPLTAVTEALHSGQPIRLIGMVDDATGELLTTLARHAGARMTWLGQHSADPRQTRHQVINDRAAQGSALALAEQLQQEAAGFRLNAEQPFARKTALQLASARTGAASSHWAAHLGHALARPSAPVDAAYLPTTSKRLEGRFVSFVIEV
ncbi:hypothetical protein [Marinobacterium marinum]|uniref:Uncharacterized protein n=1 Tax=Marinobacterium marinum TaxID=2756129 RepID=A0A7W1WWU1_9GAMM|nr:hypothetical protein [Marinobacterium marinum]MBA4501592.1 hypothetical protein [Marinobacterium marinum]